MTEHNGTSKKDNENGSSSMRTVENSQQSENSVTLPCYGKRKCPLAPHNKKRQWCRNFEGCLDRFILAELLKGTSLGSIKGKMVNDVCLGWSDYLALHRIGRVAVSNGFQFGRVKVDSLIRNSTIPSHADPAFEAKEIRFAFRVEGRRGRGAKKKVPKQTTKWAPCHHRCIERVEAIT